MALCACSFCPATHSEQPVSLEFSHRSSLLLGRPAAQEPSPGPLGSGLRGSRSPENIHTYCLSQEDCALLLYESMSERALPCLPSVLLHHFLRTPH
uniref:Uncharacterized protein n=1 Tax=Gasterosteus aculeatus TaxID=69293 RepID=G3P566_GASAC